MESPTIPVRGHISIRKIGGAYIFWVWNQVVVEVIVREEFGTFINWRDNEKLADDAVLFGLIAEYDERVAAVARSLPLPMDGQDFHHFGEE